MALRDMLYSDAGSGSAANPEELYLRGLATYLRQSGHKADPLVSEGATPNAPALIHGSGSRSGLMGAEVKIGPNVFHVYFHPNGQREVVKVAGPGIHTPPVAGGLGRFGGPAAQATGPAVTPGGLTAWGAHAAVPMPATGGMLAP